MKASLLNLLAIAGAGLTSAVSAQDQLTVSSNAGTFAGQLSSPTVRNWLGIRYGHRTSGYNRFRPPQRAAILTETFNATSYSPTCPQNRGTSYTAIDRLTNLGNATDGEDCLSVNIWAPTVERLNSTVNRNTTYEGAAVMIWFYGGAFAFGSSNTPSYDGNNFVRDQEDVIIVTINYRISIFGFPAGAPSISNYERNVGLKDQRLAVEWVYDNIREFGGDPERITLFGESAGAASIGGWAYAYQFDPIAKGFIMESGSEVTLAQSEVTNQTNAAIAWDYVATTAGCALNATGSAMNQLECLQKLDFHIIQNITSKYAGAGTFVPSQDDILVLSSAEYGRRLRSGEYARVPTFIGNNRDEGSLLAALYPGVSPANVTAFGYTCPNSMIAQSRSAYSVPVWQYRYEGLYPSLTPIPGLGVFHSSEIPLVFGTYNVSTLAPPTSELIATSKVMQGGWAAFAKDPVSGLIDYGWPLYKVNGSTLIELGYNNQSMPNFTNSTMFNGPCSMPQMLSRGY